jgi:hypothetical protein
MAGGEIAAQRFGAQVFEFGDILDFSARYEFYQSEAAWIVVDQDATVVEHKFDMIVPRIEAPGIEIPAAMGQAAAHSKVHQQQLIASYFDQEVLCAASDSLNCTAGDDRGQFRGD